ncbi:hypothetical protein [Demequina mangrovi]|uniref:hypothetical protein n=1 Tax=Demequina mangrovi TaxID=1043493 RepID=UPI0005A9C64D|nr:hypothetical protein [Demequina mangrovi]
MDAALAMQERARRDVDALRLCDVPSVRELRDLRLATLSRHARRLARRTMRAEGTLRPWYARSPVLMVALPLALAWGVLFTSIPAFFLAVVVLAWGLTSEPRLSRAERVEYTRVMTAYRNAAADALDARADRKAWGSEGPGAYGLST